MNTFRLGGPRADLRRRDELRQGAVVFESPRGLAKPQALLIEALPKKAPGRSLFGMDTEGAVALAAGSIWQGAKRDWFHLDAYVARKVARTLSEHRDEGVDPQALEDPPTGPYDLIALPFPRTGEHLLMRDLLERAHDALRVGGRMIAATDGKPDALRKQLKKVFGNFTPAAPRGIRGACFYAERKRAGSVSSDHSHVLETEIAHAGGDGSTHVSVETRPGTFSHGSVDRGSRALAQWLEPGDADSVLDIGAGCGLLGLYLAKRLPHAQVTLVDSNARAVACARRNAERNGVADRVQVLLRADLEDIPDPPGGEGYACVVANPPYFGQMRIAGSFSFTAHAHCRPGGRVSMVARTGGAAMQLFEVIDGRFGGMRARVHEVGDYSVVSATR